MLHFCVLGRLTVDADDGDCTPSAPMVRRVLGQLLLSTNKIVTLDAIIDELWGDRPPRSAVPTAQTYIYQLRRHFEPWVAPNSVETMLATCGTSYVLRVEPDQLDLHTFARLTKEGYAALASGDAAAAACLLREALDLWTGPALADVTCGPATQAHIVYLREQRAHALEMRIKADTMLGRHRELVGELMAILETDRLNEWYHGELIKALACTGRRHESLLAYQRLRETLSSELGLDPSTSLQAIHQEVLAGRDSWSA